MSSRGSIVNEELPKIIEYYFKFKVPKIKYYLLPKITLNLIPLGSKKHKKKMR